MTIRDAISSSARHWLGALTLTAAVPLLSCGRKPASEGLVEQTITLNLTRQGITLDRNGYEGSVCIEGAGCNPAQPVTLPAGRHRIYSDDSTEPGGGWNPTLGYITVDDTNNGVIESSHFVEEPGNRIVLQTVPVTVIAPGYRGLIGFGWSYLWDLNRAELGHRFTTRLIADRRYHMLDVHSQALDPTQSHPFGSLGVHIRSSSQTVDDMGEQVRATFDFDPATRTFTARVQPVVLDYNGYPGYIGFNSLPTTGGPQPANLVLLRGRRYWLFDYGSVDRTAWSHMLTPSGDVRVEADGTINLGAGSSQFFTKVGNDRLQARVGSIEAVSTGYFYLLNVMASSGGAPVAGSFLLGRRYNLYPNNQWIEFTPQGTCTPGGPFSLTWGGTVTLTCSPTPVDLVPRLSCVTDNPQGGRVAIFGYRNGRRENVQVIPSADNNVVSPGAIDQGQPSWFKAHTGPPGTITERAAFSVNFSPDEDVVSWKLGPYTVRSNQTPDSSCTMTEAGDGEIVSFSDAPQTPFLVRTIPAMAVAGARVATTTVPGDSHRAAGFFRGRFAVSHDGAATYTIPLKVPAGRRGIQPALSLNYHSRAGNGPLGVGWSLGGLSEIRVCKTNLRIDAAHEPIRFFREDTPLCLDGQRLMPITGFTAGADVPAGLRAAANEPEYRTERTDGSRIIGRSPASAAQLPSWFEVATPDGRILRYGRHPTAVQVTNPANLGVLTRRGRWAGSNGATDVVAAWPLTQIRDRFGNVMEFLYEVELRTPPGNETDTRFPIYEHRIKEIHYTAFDGAGASSRTGQRSIRFVYEGRASNHDYPHSVFLDMNWGVSKRLRRIEAHAPTGHGIRPIRYYHLDYEPISDEAPGDTGRSRISSISECEPGLGNVIEGPGAGNDVCLPALTFEWSRNTATFERINTGILDVMTATSHEPDPQFGSAAISTADVDGDGADDIMYPVFVSGGVRTFKIAYSLGRGRRPVGQSWPPTNPFWFRPGGSLPPMSSYINRFSAAHPTFVDLDSDGRSEILVPFMNLVEDQTYDKPFYGPSEPPGPYTFRRHMFTTFLAQWSTSGLVALDGPAWSSVWPEQSEARISVLGRLVQPLHPKRFIGNLVVRPIDRRGAGRFDLAVARVDGRLIDPYRPPVNAQYTTCSQVGSGGSGPCTGATDDEWTAAENVCMALGPERQQCENKYHWHMLPTLGTNLAFGPPETPIFETARFDIRETGVGAYDREHNGYQALEAASNPRMVIADLNGDGRPDEVEIVVPGEHRTSASAAPSVVVSIGGGPRYRFAPPPSGLDTADAANFRAIDFDGDGRQELVLVSASSPRDPANAPGNLRVWKWADHALVPVTSFTVPVGAVASGPRGYAHFRARCAPAGVPISSSTPQKNVSSDCGNSYSREHCGPVYPRWGDEDCVIDQGVAPTPGQFKLQTQYRTTQALDWNGDGLPDFVTVSREPNRELILYVQKSSPGDMVTRFWEGTGATVDVAYSPATDTNHFEGMDAPCAYPLTCKRKGVWAVTSVTRDVGTTTPQVTEHRYGRIRFDAIGRGWLGFEHHDERTTVDFTGPSGKRTAHTLYRRTEFGLDDGTGQFPFAQVPMEIKTTLAPDEPLNKRIHMWRTYVQADEVIRGVPGTTPGSHPLVHFVNLRRVVSEDREGVIVDANDPELLHDLPPAKLTLQKETFRTVIRDAYGNVDLATDEVAGRENGQMAIILSADENPEFTGSTTTFSEARFLGLKAAHTTTIRYRDKPERIRVDRYTAPSPATATNDTIAIEPDNDDPDVRSTHVTRRDSFGLVSANEVQAVEKGAPRSRVVTVTYDENEHLYPHTVSNPLEIESTTLYLPGLDVPAYSRSPNGVVARAAYDGFGRLRRSYGQASAETTVDYTTSGLFPLVVTSVAGPSIQGSGAGTRVSYDHLGREVKSARKPRSNDWSAAEFTTTYDQLGRVSTTKGPHLDETLEYDDLGRLTKSIRRRDATDTLAQAGTYVTTYTPSTFEVSVSADNNSESTEYFDALGLIQRKTEKKDDLGNRVETRFDWRAPGLLGEVVHPGGSKTTLDYDALGRRTSLTTPDTGSTTTSYSGFGDTRLQVDAENRRTITEDFDVLGRLLEQRDVRSGTTATTTFAYDHAPNGNGLLERASNLSDGVTTSFEYEPTFGALAVTRLQVPGVPDALVSTNRYDSRGRLAEIDYPATGTGSPFTVQYNYHDNDELLTAVDYTGGSFRRLIWYAMESDPLGRILAESWDVRTVSRRTYWPETGRLRTITTGPVDGPASSLQDLTLTYGADGNLTSRRDANSGFRGSAGFWEGFRYDPLGRLRHWYQKTSLAQEPPTSPDGRWQGSYEYDDRGNLEHRTASIPGVGSEDVTQRYGGSVGGANRLRSSTLWGETPDREFVYDAVGNVTRHPTIGTIEYTPYNLPKRTLGTPSTPATEYLYDAFGQRVSKRATAGGSRTIYMGGIYERRIEGETTHVMHVFAGDRLVAQVNRSAAGTEELSLVYSDDMGSPHVVDGPGGARTVSKRDPFGNQLPAAASGSVEDIRLSATVMPPGGAGRMTKGFTGHELDGELGVVNMQGRIYEPRTGRFLQADPFVSSPFESQAHNRYAYVLNSPTKYVDPTGFCGVELDTMGNVKIKECPTPPPQPVVLGITSRIEPFQGFQFEQPDFPAPKQGFDRPPPPPPPDRVWRQPGDYELGAPTFGARENTYIQVSDRQNGWPFGYDDEGRANVPVLIAPVTGKEALAVFDLFKILNDLRLPINRQKQDGHIDGTPQYLNRVKQGKPTSTWFGDRKQADALTREAWNKGTPVPGKPYERIYETGRPVGSGPFGVGWQTQVRVSNGQGGLHGSPWGKVYHGPLPPPPPPPMPPGTI